MNVVGLITEYNPFHNGHKYHIEQAKKITGADYVVVVMSGNFVQRGAPAIVDKYTRCEIALTEGADLVFELPVTYATASAETFALGAVKILTSLGFVTSICFGSECGDVSLLTEIAQCLADEPYEFKELLSIGLKNGVSYPVARQNALASYISESRHLTCSKKEQLNEILKSPNNILGIEYIKALCLLDSPIVPYTITRVQNGYHEQSLTGTISSASSIRAHLKEVEFSLQELQETMPANAYSIFESRYTKSCPIVDNDFSSLLYYKLLYTEKEELSNYLDINEDLSYKISNLKAKSTTITSLADSLKSKDITYTRITRTLFHLLLEIKKEMFPANKEAFPIYLRLLGMKKDASFLLKHTRKHSPDPIITKVADARDKLSEESYAHFSCELNACAIYNRIVYYKFHYEPTDEYRKGVIIKP